MRWPLVMRESKGVYGFIWFFKCICPKLNTNCKTCSHTGYTLFPDGDRLSFITEHINQSVSFCKIKVTVKLGRNIGYHAVTEIKPCLTRAVLNV